MICRSNMIPFGNGDYHKGLFIDGRLSVDFERELDKVTFGKCEIFPCDADLPCPYEDSSAQIFLHGSCDLFAKQFREKFNYDIYEILDKKGRPIHWYAQSNYQGRPAYIDVRGATTNFEEFLYEFKFLAGDDYEIHQRNDDMSHIGEDWVETGIQFAKYVINANPGYYKI